MELQTNKIFLLNPRESGKTSKAIYEYLKSPENTLYVTLNENLAKQICQSINGIKKNFISSKQFETYLRGRNYIKNIIFDEYLFYKNKVEVYEEFQKHNIKNLYIF